MNLQVKLLNKSIDLVNITCKDLIGRGCNDTNSARVELKLL